MLGGDGTPCRPAHLCPITLTSLRSDTAERARTCIAAAAAAAAAVRY